MIPPAQSNRVPAERVGIVEAAYGRDAMTLGHLHLIHRRRQRDASGKLMVGVFIAASHLVPTVDRDRERDAIVTDPYER